MFYERACDIVRKGHSLVEAEGQSGLIKVIKYIAINFFRYSKVVVYETDLTNISTSDIAVPQIENMELIIITSEDQLKKLQEKDYDFSFYPNLKVDKIRFKMGACLITIFINRDLAFKDWLALTRESVYKLGPFIKCLIYDGQAVGDAAETNPKYRGQGLFHYATANKIRYAHQMGKSKLLAFVESDNTASCKVQERIGSIVTHTGYRIRLLYLWDIFRIKPSFNRGN